MPPAPSRQSISYGPSLVPGTSIIAAENTRCADAAGEQNASSFAGCAGGVWLRERQNRSGIANPIGWDWSALARVARTLYPVPVCERIEQMCRFAGRCDGQRLVPLRQEYAEFLAK